MSEPAPLDRMPAGAARRAFVLITGARDWWDYAQLATVLAEEFDAAPHALLVHGECENSPDTVAAAIWAAWGGAVKDCPADWSGPCRPTCPPGHRRRNARGQRYCPLAGIYRNGAMVAQCALYAAAGARVSVVAFITPASRGAVHCAGVARAAGLDPRTFTSPSRARPGGDRDDVPNVPADHPQEVLF